MTTVLLYVWVGSCLTLFFMLLFCFDVRLTVPAQFLRPRAFLKMWYHHIWTLLPVSSRHIRQQGRRHPGPVRWRLHRQRHWLQRRQCLSWHRRGLDHCRRRLALQRQDVQGGPRKPGLLRHPLHHPSCGVCDRAAVPASGDSGRRWAGRATDLQDANIAAVRLTVADLHPAGFAGSLLPFTMVLNREDRRGWETHCQYEKREKEESLKRDRTRKDG